MNRGILVTFLTGAPKRFSSRRREPRMPKASKGTRRVPKTTTIILHIDGLEVPVAVRRASVKNLNLRVRSDGSVSASVPHRVPWPDVEAFVHRRAGWIARHVSRADGAPAANAPAPPLIPLWGEAVDTASRLAWTGPLDDLCRTEFEHRLDALYRRETARALERRTGRWEQAMGVSASSWSVRSMKTRWGSCTPARRSIRINARLAAYPPACLDFVIAHELCHLMEPSHNARFHALLDIYCPDNRAAAELLKRPPAEVARITPARGAHAPGGLP